MYSRVAVSDIRPQDLSVFTLCVQTSPSELSIGLAILSNHLVGQEWQSVGVLETTFKLPSEYERSLNELEIAIGWLSVCKKSIGRLERRSSSLASVGDHFTGQEWRSIGWASVAINWRAKNGDELAERL